MKKINKFKKKGNAANQFKGASKLPGLPWWRRGKESARQAGDAGSIPGSGMSLGSKWLPTPVWYPFQPGKFHGQRNMTGCSPWGHKRVRHDLATKQETYL